MARAAPPDGELGGKAGQGARGGLFSLVFVFEQGPLVVLVVTRTAVDVRLAGADFHERRNDDANDERCAHKHPDASIRFEKKMIYSPKIHSAHHCSERDAFLSNEAGGAEGGCIERTGLLIRREPSLPVDFLQGSNERAVLSYTECLTKTKEQ